jgi:hypothetical protein
MVMSRAAPACPWVLAVSSASRMIAVTSIVPADSPTTLAAAARPRTKMSSHSNIFRISDAVLVALATKAAYTWFGCSRGDRIWPDLSGFHYDERWSGLYIRDRRAMDTNPSEQHRTHCEAPLFIVLCQLGEGRILSSAGPQYLLVCRLFLAEILVSAPVCGLAARALCSDRLSEILTGYPSNLRTQ